MVAIALTLGGSSQAASSSIPSPTMAAALHAWGSSTPTRRPEAFEGRWKLEEWDEVENSPHKGSQGLWPMAWPQVGGGGHLEKRCNENEMFERISGEMA